MSGQGVDLHIIGGGIIGLCSAVQLQARGVKVVLMDAQSVGKGASYGNAGHLATEQVFPIADVSTLKQVPSMLLNPEGPLHIDWRYLPRLLPWAIQLLINMSSKNFERTHSSLLEINAKSLSSWENFAKTWDLNKWVKVEGSLLTVEEPMSLDKLVKHGKRLNNLGVDNLLLSQNQLLDYEPALKDNQLGALFFPKTGHITNLSAVIKQLVNIFKKLGGEIIENCRVLDAKNNIDGVLLTTNQGEFQANKVMISTGAYSKELTKKLTGISVPLDTERGYHLMLPFEKDKLKIPVSSMDRRFIMTPMEEGLRLAGTVEYAGLEAPANMQRAQLLLSQAQGMLHSTLNNKDSNPWMGFRPSTADSLPVMEKCGKVFLNFGHQHLGLTQAVISAQIMTALYFNETPFINVTPYQLNRFK